MDPAYRPFFAHVWAFCWPWLWWNLVRLTAWRRRTRRAVFISVDRYGNIYINYVGDAPKPDSLYTYEPPGRMPWERLAPGAAPAGPARAGAPGAVLSCGAAQAAGPRCALQAARPAPVHVPP